MNGWYTTAVQVQLSPWRCHHSMGRVRELQFVTKLKASSPPFILDKP